MKKRFFYILLVLFVLVLILMCLKGDKGSQNDSNNDTDLSSGVLDDSDVSTESRDDQIEVHEKQGDEKNSEIMKEKDTVPNQSDSNDSGYIDLPDDDIEKNKDTSAIKEITDMGDMIEPPPVSSAGVL